MKPVLAKKWKAILTVTVVAFTVVMVSWGQKQTGGKYEKVTNDTTPKGVKEKKIRDLDDVLEEVNNADMKLDMEKIQKQITEALKSVDADKLKLEIDKAMKEVDMANIQKEIQESLSKVDYEKIKTEVANAMKEVDMAKMQKELQESLAKVDYDKIKAEVAQALKEVDMVKIQKELQESLQKVKEIDMKKMEKELEKVKEEMKNIKPELEKELSKAKEEIEKAKVEIREYKDFTDGLQDDGLISKKEGYTLKHKDGELFINGKKASEQTYNKYRNFLEKHKKFSIEKKDDDFNIDMD